ncbi:GNAT family N-acetyltransferase [Cellulomonas marina]|uniref:Protein N-acetyltransferase, RimJ/RimL family n=1 Tax=Cellulomonas marina TaxID=988821 RepID=A0A1I0Z0B5_9CELL|nr:GNAT family protein [Cellulomonas marina]GIG28152.1 N-acetyltransferase [Cellulomonas marina]SFB19054.1 Protein N-acetyltransferase, RimJ/RimL family [Cellulomonas marina]
MRHDLVLTGPGLRLVPLEEDHAGPLVALVDDALWAGMSTPVPRSADDMAAWVAAAHRAPGRLAFAVVGDQGEVRGSTSFYDVDEHARRLEIGSTFYGRAWWGGRTNPACKLLLLRHAFEVMGMQRVALRADARNARSIAAIRRLGARPEGVLRSHRVDPTGARADTAYFSLLPDEWPAARTALERRLGLTGDGHPRP